MPDTVDLPFLIDDLTPREIRVPPVDHDYHSNGILGINGIAVLGQQPWLKAWLIIAPCSLSCRSPNPQFPQPGTQSSEFTLDKSFSFHNWCAAGKFGRCAAC